MEIHYKSIGVALQPQPREIPLPPFREEALQRVFADLGPAFAYESFEFIFDRRGARFSNGEEDFVELRPALFQVQAKMDGPDLLTAELAQKKVIRILKTAAERLGVPGFLQCTTQVFALVNVPGPNPDAKRFVAEKLMASVEHPDELGPGFFGGGVQFRKIFDDGSGEEILRIEPFVHDNDLIFLNHQINRAFGAELDQLGTWIDEGFEFLSGSVMRLLDR